VLSTDAIPGGRAATRGVIAHIQMQVAIASAGVENRCMESSSAPREAASSARDPFATGAVVMVTLAGPREKFWGAIAAITPAGVSVSGVDLNSFDDFIRMLRAHEPATPSTVFFPMYRIERIELDLPASGLPSVRERFEAATGQTLHSILRHPQIAAISVGCTLEEAQKALIQATLDACRGDVARAAALLGISEQELRDRRP
jgi:hypothetical protein